MSDRLREVGLAHADRADQEQRLLALDEAAGRKVPDLGRGDLRVEGEIEVRKGLRLVEARALDAPRERAGRASLDLILDQEPEEGEVPELLLVRLIRRAATGVKPNDVISA